MRSMTSGQFFSRVMPIWAIIYVILIVITHNKIVVVVGALIFALLGIVGSQFFRSSRSAKDGGADGPPVGRDRQRNRNRNR